MTNPSTTTVQGPGDHRSLLLLLSGLVAAILLVVVAIGGAEFAKTNNAAGATISVGGTGTVQGVPDTAAFSIGVHTVNVSAKGAEQENNRKIAALIAALTKSGMEAKEIQTSGLNIYQSTNSVGVVTGYTVDNTLNVTTHHVSKVGGAIDAATTVVGNAIQLNGITFSITNQSSFLASARTKAMENARRVADQLAKAGGTHVTGVLHVSEQENPVTPIFYGTSGAFSDMSSRSPVPVQTGRQTVTVQVSVVYSVG